MKHLYLVRHGKSSWKHDVGDHQRPLKKRGFNDANLVSNHLKSIINLPERIISSDANRALTTAKIFISNFGIDENEIIQNTDLYDFSGGALIDAIKSCDDSIDILMIFGHNYAMTNVVNSYGSKYISNVPTSGFTHIEFEINSWKDLKKGNTKLTVFPRDLKN